MRLHRPSLLAVFLALGISQAVYGQQPVPDRISEISPPPIARSPGVLDDQKSVIPAPTLPVVGDAGANQQTTDDLKALLIRLQKDIAQLQAQQGVVLVAAQKDDTLKTQVELLQKQIATQQKMIVLLMDQMKKQPAAGAAVEQLQTQIATLEARSKQAAQRDVEAAAAIDKLTEQRDADLRNPTLPEQLKQMFLPGGANESPLSIYGQFLFGYQQINSQPGSFSPPDFSPYFLLKLNESFLLQANIDISGDGSVSLGLAEMNWFATDWLTVVIGRSLTPIGFYNERIGHEWINRLPDAPLMFQQVSPLLSTDGMQLRGAFYLFGSPVKLEYTFYGGNGFNNNGLTSPPANYSDVASLSSVVSNSAPTPGYGGRIGFWIPEWGITTGISSYYNGAYGPTPAVGVQDFPDRWNIWQFDFGFRRGNWDFRFEYAEMNQDAASYIGNDIRRTGLYAQVAYRPFDAASKLLRNSEVVFRYSRARFSGIDPTQLTLDPTQGVSIPVDRDQYTVGYNYYIAPAMAVRFAYEWNIETDPAIRAALNDNMFMFQYVWAF